MEETKREGNIIAGLVGAFLLSIGGGLVCFLFYQIGYISSVSGFVAVVLACKGYEWFSKKESVPGVIVSAVIAILVLVLSYFISLGNDLYKAYIEWYLNGEVDYRLSFFQACRTVPYLLLEDGDFLLSVLKDLGMLLLFAIGGSIGYIVNLTRRINDTESRAKFRHDVDPSYVEANTGSGYFPGANDSPVLRSAGYGEKEKIYLIKEVRDHEIIYRKYGKGCEELVVDGKVYAEFLFKGIAKPHTMSATVFGMRIEVGYFRINYINVDGQQVASSTRWI